MIFGGCGGSVFPPPYTNPKGNVNAYRRQLERRLAEKYNNMPEFAGKISKVELVIGQPPMRAVDRNEMQVEYDQLVYDKWGRRVPKLEKEYFRVTFGDGQARVVPSDPTLQIGLKTEGEFSERQAVDTGLIGSLREKEKAVPNPSAPTKQPLPHLLPEEKPSPTPDRDGIPTVPPAQEDWMPSTRTESAPSTAPAASEPLQTLTPPAANGTTPKTGVRILREAAPELE